MSKRTTRRAFVGGTIAAAAGAGVANIGRLEALTRSKHALSLSVDRLHAEQSLPAFGTLRPDETADSAQWGDLLDRRSRVRAGSIAITPIAGSAGRAHTVTLADGTIVAAGVGALGRYPVVFGTGRYASATGHLTTSAA